MRSHIYIASSADAERETILNRLDQRTQQQISANSLETLSRSCQPVASPLSLVIRIIEYRHNEFAENTGLSSSPGSSLKRPSSAKRARRPSH